MTVARIRWVFVLMLMSASCVPQRQTDTSRRLGAVYRWAAVYGRIDLGCLPPSLQLLVVDPRQPTEPSDLRRSGVDRVIAYLSVGEIALGNPEYQRFAHVPWLVERNPDWPSQRVDVRASQWRTFIRQERVPALIRRGYDGVMLDTVGVAAFLEERSPEKFRGSRAAMHKLIRDVRKAWPKGIVMVNSDIEPIAPVVPSLDGIIVESVFGGFEPTRGTYKISRSNAHRTALLKQIRRVHQQDAVPVFPIEYIDPNDRQGRLRAQAVYGSVGARPYFAPPDLATFGAIQTAVGEFEPAPECRATTSSVSVSAATTGTATPTVTATTTIAGTTTTAVAARATATSTLAPLGAAALTATTAVHAAFAVPSALSATSTMSTMTPSIAVAGPALSIAATATLSAVTSARVTPSTVAASPRTATAVTTTVADGR